MPDQNGQDESLYRDILDEILYRDPPDASRYAEVTGNVTKKMEVITFADGSRLTIAAQVPMPPLADMTPVRVFFLKGDGQKGERWDDGSNEALGLAHQSMAVRLLEKISQMLDSLPERDKITCPSCKGKARCGHCNGSGCEKCLETGQCPRCDGRGIIAKE